MTVWPSGLRRWLKVSAWVRIPQLLGHIYYQTWCSSPTGNRRRQDVRRSVCGPPQDSSSPAVPRPAPPHLDDVVRCEMAWHDGPAVMRAWWGTALYGGRRPRGTRTLRASPMDFQPITVATRAWCPCTVAIPSPNASDHQALHWTSYKLYSWRPAPACAPGHFL